MKASELIELLKRKIEDHGDLIVVSGKHDREIINVRFVEIDPQISKRGLTLIRDPKPRINRVNGVAVCRKY